MFAHFRKSAKARLPAEINFMNGAGRFLPHGIIHPAGKNWQQREPHLKGQSANSLLLVPSAPTPVASPTRPAAPSPGSPPAPLPVCGGAGGGAGVKSWSGFGLQFPSAREPVPSSPAPGSSLSARMTLEPP